MNTEKPECWTEALKKTNFDTEAFARKLQAVQSGKPVDWTCPFCGGRVVLLEKDDKLTVIGCLSCDMRIRLGEF